VLSGWPVWGKWKATVSSDTADPKSSASTSRKPEISDKVEWPPWVLYVQDIT
jgi:hypothetical protein